MAGELIVDAMSEDFDKDSAWRDSYDAQSIRNVIEADTAKNLSIEGNDKEFRKQLKYYEDTYDISRGDIDKPNVGPKYEAIQKGLEGFIKTGQMDPEAQKGLQKLSNPQGNGVANNTVEPPQTPDMRGEFGIPHLTPEIPSIAMINGFRGHGGMG